jgi:Protein of unknown function (DUF3592)
MLSIGVGLLVTGAALAAAGYLLAVPTRRFLRTALDADGTVVALAASARPGGGSDRYAVVVEFATNDGTAVRWTDNTASTPPIAQPGDRVRVKYDPARPQQARLASPERLFLLPRTLVATGALFAALGAVLAVLGLLF